MDDPSHASGVPNDRISLFCEYSLINQIKLAGNAYNAMIIMFWMLFVICFGPIKSYIHVTISFLLNYSNKCE